MKLEFAVEFDRQDIEAAISDAARRLLPDKEGYRIVVKMDGYSYSTRAVASLVKEEEVGEKAA